MKKVSFLFLSFFVTSTFASQYQPTQALQTIKILAIYSPSVYYKTPIRRVKIQLKLSIKKQTLKLNGPKSDQVKILLPVKSPKQSSLVNVDLDTQSIDELAYFQSLPQEQFYSLPPRSNGNHIATLLEQKQPLSNNEALSSAQYMKENNLLLNNYSFPQSQQKMTF